MIERISSETILLTKDYHEKQHNYLWISDLHLDSIHCERELLKQHLDQALDINATIFIVGDLFDVMASYGDRRLLREDVDPLFIRRGESYLDLVVDYAVDYLKPYAKNIAMISKGNHEDTISQFHNTDILARVVGAMNGSGARIMQGGYRGYLVTRYQRTKTSHATVIHHYHHGYGGSAKRSFGVLDVQMEAMKYPDAQYLIRGHTHQKWLVPSVTRQRLNKKSGKTKDEYVKYIQMGAYKHTNSETDGWEVKRNFNPTKLGGWFIEHHLARGGINHNTVYIKDKIYEAE